MKKILPETYKKYGYRMLDCAKEDLEKYILKCYEIKTIPNPSKIFSYVTFSNVDDAIKKINSVFIPARDGNLPKTEWSLSQSNSLLIKEIWFYTHQDQHQYQCAVERGWALGGHLDQRVEQVFYD